MTKSNPVPFGRRSPMEHERDEAPEEQRALELLKAYQRGKKDAFLQVRRALQSWTEGE